jgi:hypothetical protein
LNADEPNNGLWHVLVAVAQALDEVKLGLIKPDQVDESYCDCHAGSELTTEHACMICLNVRLCHQMPLTGDGRRICRDCAEKWAAISDKIKFTVQTKVRHLCNRILNKEQNAGHEVKVTADQLVAVLERFVIGDLEWQDGYDGPQNLNDAIWPAGPLGNSRGLHPGLLSIDKFNNLHVDLQGDKHLHHFENIVLTKHSINLMAGTGLKCVLPLLKAALQMRLSGQWLERAERALEAAADHERMIRSNWIPEAPKSRLQMIITPEEFHNVFLPMARGGVWTDKAAPASRDNPPRLSTRANRQSSGFDAWLAEKGFEMWSSYQIDLIRDLIRELEGSEKFNKHNLEIPRSLVDDSPWLWRSQDRGSYSTWVFLYLEMLHRLHTMDTLCDWLNFLDITPFTLLVEALRQWFMFGGRCHFFGFRLTIFAGHLQSYSIGRAVRRLDANGEANGEFIQPGAKMSTGCKPGFKTMADYDYTLTTIVFESWKVNAFRLDYPVGPNLLPLLETYILALDDSGEWFDAFVPDPARYFDVQLARQFEQTSFVRVTLPELEAGMDYEEHEDAEELDDYEEDDEEVRVWKETVTVPDVTDDDNMLVRNKADRAHMGDEEDDLDARSDDRKSGVRTSDSAITAKDTEMADVGDDRDSPHSSPDEGARWTALVRSPRARRKKNVIMPSSQEEDLAMGSGEATGEEEEFMMSGALPPTVPPLTAPIVITRPVQFPPEFEALLVPKEHVMWQFLVVFPTDHGNEVGYAATDHTYISSEGQVLGFWQDDCDVFAADSNGVQGAFIKNVLVRDTGA